MARSLRRLAPWLLIAAIAIAAWRLWPTASGPMDAALDPALLMAALSEDADPGLGESEGAKPAAGWTPSLPRDLGPHPDARAEVWDLTGRLRDTGGQRYGVRLTLVRLTLVSKPTERPSRLAAEALLLGRFELLPATGEPVRGQRASRLAVGLAGADPDPPRVWLEDWSLTLGGAEPNAPGGLAVRMDDLQLELTLTPAKAALAPAQDLLDGDGPAGRGLEASVHWLAQPRLALAGRLSRSGRELDVEGTGWLDRVWGDVTAAGGIAGTRGQLALNRFLLQLDDGSELLCIHLRRRAGGGTPIPTCLAVAGDGETRLLSRHDLSLTPGEDRWRSPGHGARYPVRWRLDAPPLGLALDIDALRPDQALILGERLWSGTIDVTGKRDGRAIAGSGRMDLSGYGEMAGG